MELGSPKMLMHINCPSNKEKKTAKLIRLGEDSRIHPHNEDLNSQIFSLLQNELAKMTLEALFMI